MGLLMVVLGAAVFLGGCGGGDGDATTAVISYTLEVNAEPGFGGTVEGDGAIDNGTEVAVTASPYYHFVNWTEGGTEVSTSAAYTFNITADCNLTANFKMDSYTVSTNDSANGGITPSIATVSHGAIAEFTVIAAAGHTLG